LVALTKFILQVLGRAKTTLASIGHDTNTGTQRFTFLHAVSGQNDTSLFFLGIVPPRHHIGHKLPTLPTSHWIDSGRAFIQKHNLRLPNRGTGQ
jgi:hypothetical protein